MLGSMSVLASYKKLGPFNIDELVDAVNSLLRGKGIPPFTKRTLRFYIAREIVPPPMGSPKYARYGYEHMLGLVATRMLQDQGTKLDRIIKEVAEIQKGQFERMEERVEAWIAQPRPSVLLGPLEVRESKSGYGNKEKQLVLGSRVQRITLTRHSYLEVPEEGIQTELPKALEELQKLVRNLG